MKKTTIKRTAIILVAATMAISTLGLMAACGNNNNASNQTETQAAGMANPMEEISSSNLPIPMKAPSSAAGVKYFKINVDNEEPIYEMQFSMGGVDFTFRAQSTQNLEAQDISGMHYDNWETEKANFQRFDVTVKHCDEATVAYWMDIVPGIQYSLSATGNVATETMMETANEVMVPAQGEADADVKDEFTGEFKNEDGDTVSIKKSGDTYDVTIGICRLANFEGKGEARDGAVHFELTDPNGGKVAGYFFKSPAKEGTFEVTFAESSWDLLESGSSFTGFTPAN